MFARQSLKPSSVLAAVVVGGGGYTLYRYASTTSRFPTVHADAPQQKKIFPASGFVDFTLHSSEMVNHNVKRLRFALPDADTVTGMEPISSLLTKHTPNGAWIPVFRPYTPIIDDEPGYVTFLVKKYPNGRASGQLHSMVPGEKLSFKVLSEFPYKPNQFESIGLIAGGSGITPIYQLIRKVLGNPADKTRLTLVYANNSEQDILLKKEFDALEKQYPEQFRASYAVSSPSSGSDSTGAGAFHKGYITKEILEEMVPDAKAGGEKVKVLVSGPPPMTAAIAGAKGGFGWTQGSMGGILAELGFEKGQIFKF